MLYEIVLYKSFEKVNFYSVRVEGEELSLVERFMSTFGDDKTLRPQLRKIIGVINLMGKDSGAKVSFFRAEANTFALPQKSTRYEGPDGSLSHVMLRLYCLRVTDGIVILFGGHLKNARTNQECSNVLPHFNLAKKITRSFDDARLNKMIEISENQLTGELTLFT